MSFFQYTYDLTKIIEWNTFDIMLYIFIQFFKSYKIFVKSILLTVIILFYNELLSILKHNISSEFLKLRCTFVKLVKSFMSYIHISIKNRNSNIRWSARLFPTGLIGKFQIFTEIMEISTPENFITKTCKLTLMYRPLCLK